MAYPSSSERYSSHISTTDDSISSGAHPSAADRARYPDLYPTTEEVIYSSQRASQPTETTPASQQLLLDRPSGTYHYSRSLTPAIIGMVRSAFPNARQRLGTSFKSSRSSSVSARRRPATAT